MIMLTLSSERIFNPLRSTGFYFIWNKAYLETDGWRCLAPAWLRWSASRQPHGWDGQPVASHPMPSSRQYSPRKTACNVLNWFFSERLESNVVILIQGFELKSEHVGYYIFICSIISSLYIQLHPYILKIDSKNK